MLQWRVAVCIKMEFPYKLGGSAIYGKIFKLETLQLAFALHLLSPTARERGFRTDDYSSEVVGKSSEVVETLGLHTPRLSLPKRTT
jgi:hypothetical protein